MGRRRHRRQRGDRGRGAAEGAQRRRSEAEGPDRRAGRLAVGQVPHRHLCQPGRAAEPVPERRPLGQRRRPVHGGRGEPRPRRQLLVRLGRVAPAGGRGAGRPDEVVAAAPRRPGPAPGRAALRRPDRRVPPQPAVRGPLHAGGGAGGGRGQIEIHP
jgi:hypothetical protein